MRRCELYSLNFTPFSSLEISYETQFTVAARKKIVTMSFGQHSDNSFSSYHAGAPPTGAGTYLLYSVMTILDLEYYIIY